MVRIIMKLKSKIQLTFIISILLFTIVGCRCTLLPSAEEKQKLQPISLRYWRVWDSPSNFSGILSAYSAVHPNISISMQILRYEEFERKLLEAYADQKPPDIISFHYAWLPKYVDKKYITPCPGVEPGNPEGHWLATNCNTAMRCRLMKIKELISLKRYWYRLLSYPEIRFIR